MSDDRADVDGLSGLAHTRVLPVLTMEDPAQAIELGSILADCGISHVEVALRTPDSLRALELMVSVRGLTVGAGTVLAESQMRQAVSCGASFCVSPGLDDRLVDLAHDLRLTYLPGVATASEVQHARRLGISRVKFFPASSLGGAPAISALSGPFPDMLFMPSGGVHLNNAREYLSVPTVFAVSGAWIAPTLELRERNWQAIRTKAAETMAWVRP